MRSTMRRAVLPAVWLASWGVACGESDDPNDMAVTASSSSDAPAMTTTPPPGTLPAMPSTTGPASTVTPGASTPTSTMTQAPPTTTTPSTGSAEPPSSTTVPTTDPVDTSAPPDDGAGGTAGEPPMGAGGEAPMGAGGEGGDEEEPPEPVEEPTLITSGENAYWQISEPTMGAGNATVTVNANQELQDWHGFGGTFNEAGWEALSHLSEADRDRAIRLLFDPHDGAAFTMARIPIGSSDYGLSRYSLNDSQTPDPEMNNFSIDRDRMHLIPYIKAALAVKPDLEMWGSPWSPPPWMKSNNAYDRGNMLDEHLGAHALYLARFVEEYAKEGIEVVAVQPQNEPGYLQDYPSCGWSGEQMARYIREHLGPLFAERLPNTEVWLGTLSNPQSDHQIGQTVVNNAGARAFLSGVGMQWGMQQHASYYVQQGLTVMQTEHQCGNFPSDSPDYASRPAPNDHAYALESWGLMQNWLTSGVNSYLAWNMVLNTMGRNLDQLRPWNQNALLVVDEAAGTLRVTPTYYVFRHFSQYIEPGAKRVATQGGQALAFKNPDGSIVTVVHNNGGSPAQTTIAVGGATVQFEVPPRGWATLNWQGQ